VVNKFAKVLGFDLGRYVNLLVLCALEKEAVIE
jgi:hypothetical protein